MFFWSKDYFVFSLEKDNLKIELILFYLVLIKIVLKQHYEFCFNLCFWNDILRCTLFLKPRLCQWFPSAHKMKGKVKVAQSYPASGSFPMSWLFSSGDQSIGISAPASILPVNVRDWFPLGLTDFISLHSKGLSIFSSTAIQKHQVLGTQPSLWSSSHIHTWPLEKP